MSVREALIIGSFNPNPKWLPLKEILEQFAKIRDAIATTEHFDSDVIEAYIANISFVYAFNETGNGT